MYSNIHINSAVRFLPFNSLCFVDAKQTYNPGDTWNFNKTIWSLCHLVRPSRANNRRNCWNDSADRLHCNRERLCNLGRFEVLSAITQ